MSDVKYTFFRSDTNHEISGRLNSGNTETHTVFSGWGYAIYCYDFRKERAKKPIAVFRLKQLKPVNK